jgi:hypothetical protein
VVDSQSTSEGVNSVAENNASSALDDFDLQIDKAYYLVLGLVLEDGQSNFGLYGKSLVFYTSFLFDTIAKWGTKSYWLSLDLMASSRLQRRTQSLRNFMKYPVAKVLIVAGSNARVTWQ